MRWIWVRHGETAENAKGCYLGHYDAYLSERGRLQAQSIAERIEAILGGEPVSRLYTSDLSRCQETAVRLGCRFQVQPQAVRELRELHFGDWDCKTYVQVKLENPDRLDSWYRNPFEVAPPGGETLRQFAKRLNDWIRGEQNRFGKNETVVFVTHGGPIRWFLSHWILDEPRKFWEVSAVATGQALLAEWNGKQWETALLD